MKTKSIFRTSLWVLTAALVLGGCSTKPVQVGEGEIIEPVYPADRVLKDDVDYVADIYDPWTGFNRTMYRFNYQFDRFVFLPAVTGYQWITPKVGQKGINNFFNNWRDVTSIINCILQFEGQKVVETSARVVWNTTAGLLGFIDVASGMDLPRHQEDFGQTLGVWGVGPGPYLVLPILGPSSLRDGVGWGVDWYTIGLIRDAVVDLETYQAVALGVLDAVDTRANIPFRYFETGTPFEYETVRLLYSTKRKMDIEK
jgi:phospholipid-binding lipoprotein MlaA